MAGLRFGGAAVFLATFGFARWVLFRTLAWPRLGGTLGCVALALVAPRVPALWALLALVVVLIAANVGDHLRACRGRPQPPPHPGR